MKRGILGLLAVTTILLYSVQWMDTGPPGKASPIYASHIEKSQVPVLDQVFDLQVAPVDQVINTAAPVSVDSDIDYAVYKYFEKPVDSKAAIQERLRLRGYYALKWPIRQSEFPSDSDPPDYNLMT